MQCCVVLSYSVQMPISAAVSAPRETVDVLSNNTVDSAVSSIRAESSPAVCTHLWKTLLPFPNRAMKLSNVRARSFIHGIVTKVLPPFLVRSFFESFL